MKTMNLEIVNTAVARSTKTLALLIFGLPTLLFGEVVGVFYDQAVPQISFAAGDVKAALEAKGFSVETRSLATLDSSYTNKKVVIALNADSAVNALLSAQGGGAIGALGEQAYAMRTTTGGQTSYWVIGGDANGAMYGGLQVAENIQFSGFVGTFNNDVTPTVMRRGAKLNLPMDRRLPTYSGYFGYDSGKRAIKQVWEMSFWTEWIDAQARNRNNILSVWLHNPFPALVRTPGFENATLPHIEDTEGNAYTHLTHDVRVQFWKDVIDYAHSRGFLFYFYNWNISPDYASSQYPAITDSRSNTTTIAYYKASIKALFATYPNLDGHGVGTGDNMVGTTTADKQANPQWSWKAYGEGVTEYARANPNRKIFFIHRLLKTSYDYVHSAWAGARNIPNLQFDISVKHCIAFTYASTNPQWTKSDLEDMEAQKQATYLTLRNDGIFYGDFGDPKFVRDFINNLPSQKYASGEPRLRGYYIGHDDYAPMRSVFYKDSAMNNNDVTGTPMLEIERKWYMENIWARLAYDKNISDDVFKNLIAKRYPGLDSNKLFTAWSLASRTLPPVMDLVMGTWNLDSHMYTEMSMASGDVFRTISALGNTTVSNGSEVYLASIAETAAGNAGTRTSTYQLADSMEANANNSLQLLSTMSAGGNPRAEIVLNGVRQQALLGLYYACKIRGATFLKAGNTTQARTEMGKAYGSWMEYINSMDAMYLPEDFRYYDLRASGFHLLDAANLKEYTDLGGTNTLAQVATNGSIQLNQPGWVYPANTVVTVTAVPHKGYRFTGWAGALSGTSNPTTITVSGNKSITANFALDTNPAAVVTVVASDSTATEPSDNGAFTVTRTGSTTAALAVNFAVTGTASSSTDYTNFGTSVTIPAGQASAVVTVPVLDDVAIEPSETVVATLANGTGYTIGSPNNATVTIADNEPPLPVVTVAASGANASEPATNGTFTVTRTGSTSADLTVNFAVTGTATNDLDYASIGTAVTIPAGQSSVTQSVAVIDDAILEIGGETVIVSLTSNPAYGIGSSSSATVTIADNEVPPGETVPWTETFTYANGTTSHGSPITWTLTPATGSFRVLSNEMAFNNVGADGVFTTGAINISSGPVTVSLKVRGGAGLDVGQDFLRLYKKVDGGAEVQIGAANGPQAAATWTAAIASGSSLVLVVRAHVTATSEYYYFDDLSVTGSAPVLPTVTVSATDANAGETTPASNPGQYTFTRTGSTAAALTVNYAVSGTATSGTDYTSIGTSVSIPAGQTSATVNVAVVDDTTVESTETVIATLASGSGYTIGSPGNATVNIADNDSGGGGLPSPWVTADIGAVGAVGSATYSDPTFTIKGSGVDIISTADEFRYVSQSSSGDCTIVAKVLSIQNTNAWAKSGVMIRESTAANASNMFVFVTPTSGVTITWRAAAGGTTNNATAAVAGQTVPKWLKLTRTGNVFAAYRSDDGTTWTQVGTSQTIGMATSATLGLAVTSHADGTLCTSTMDNVTATP